MSTETTEPRALTSSVAAVLNMTVYHSLDRGIHSEVHVYDLAHKRSDAARPDPREAAQAVDAGAARKASPANQPLAPTFKWIASLPRALRPLALLQQYPRIANRLANFAREPAAMRAYLFELLIDTRGGRQGFPQDVQSELLALRTHFDASNVPAEPRAKQMR